jgi:hypothetical protein
VSIHATVDRGRAISVARLERVQRETFGPQWLEAPGCPVIVTDAMKDWPASQWDFEFFREHYGHKILPVSSTMTESAHARWVRLADYLDYVEGRKGPLAAMESHRPFYAYGYKPFRAHPELLSSFATPYFLRNLYDRIPDDLRQALNPGWIMLGKAGTVSDLHQDFFATHTWFGQVKGRKRFVLFSPTDTPYLYEGKVDPRAWDAARYPNFAKATRYECELGPGEVLVLPTNWWHHVLAEEASITLSFEFVTEENFGAFLTEIFRHLPNAVGRFLSDDRSREVLALQWRSNGFETVSTPRA